MKGWLVIFLLGILFVLTSSANAQTQVRKSGYGGGYLIVPENTTWKVDRAFVQDGDMYSIQIASKHFRESYLPGDTIRFPYYVAEMELLTKKDMVLYSLYFMETIKQ